MRRSARLEPKKGKKSLPKYKEESNSEEESPVDDEEDVYSEDNYDVKVEISEKSSEENDEEVSDENLSVFESDDDGKKKTKYLKTGKASVSMAAGTAPEKHSRLTVQDIGKKRFKFRAPAVSSKF